MAEQDLHALRAILAEHLETADGAEGDVISIFSNGEGNERQRERSIAPAFAAFIVRQGRPSTSSGCRRLIWS